MLKVENVTKYYGSLKALDKLSFTVEQGDIFGLLGVNGAGKTTAFRIIMGLLEYNGGTVTLDDRIIDYNITDEIGFLTEERSLLIKLSVLEQAKYYGVLKGMSEKQAEEALDYWLERFGISEYKNRKIKELSKGNQQKIQFIMAVLNNPKLLILDEPFAGLDPVNVEMFKEVIKEFEKKGAMIIFSSHRMEHIELFCDKIVILVEGKTVLEGSLKDIKQRFRKKNIRINADVEEERLKKIEGVINVIKIGNEYEVKIKEQKYAEAVFKYVLTCSNVVKFMIEEPTLNEIFVARVGESYE